MNRVFFLMGLLGLCACDRPRYDLQLVCEDGARGNLLVDAKIYESHADLVIKRLDKELRDKAQRKNSMWLADHVWLYNQIPNIDDKIELVLPVNKHGNYEVPGKIKLDLSHDNLTGGLNFTLWHAADNNLTMRSGDRIADGEYMVGTDCKPVLYAKNVNKNNLSAEDKNCLNYVGSQTQFDSTPTETRLRVYDEKTGREMYIIGASEINEIFGGVEPHHFYLENMNYHTEDVKHACEVATRLRAYIAEHIDEEYIQESEYVIPSGETITLTLGDEEIMIRGE